MTKRSLLTFSKYIFAFAILVGFTALVHPSRAAAANTADFQAGRIIDDGVFFDPNGLNINEIQSFLNAKVPTCDTNGTQPYDGTTRAAYGTSRGYPPPYTCLKDSVSQTTPKSADAYCQGYPQVNKTAAEIIYGVAQSCGINPRVLIVLLQKEQGLVTDDWPWSIQYRSATGYGCPDTAACDSQYYGFFNQVYHAARQFKMYAANNSSYVYQAYRNNFIQWNPVSSCGGSTVYIENLATAGLYNYTPYRPNQAALNAGYGTGDSCSSYGNRNFWLYYTDWFGNTHTPNYWWSPAGQTVYKDDTLASDTAPFVTGERRYVEVKAKNTGAATWYRWQILLGTSNKYDRSSAFYDPTWMSGNRVTTFKEASVAPGQTATFGFWVTASGPGVFHEYFNLVNEGVTWFNDNGLYLGFSVEPKRYTWSVSSQGLYSDSSYSTPLSYAPSVTRGNTIYARVVAQNTGNTTWKKNGANPVKIATLQQSSFCGGAWGGCDRPTVLKEDSVAPGQTGTFEFPMTANGSGVYREYFNLVAEGSAWFNNIGMYFPVIVQEPNYLWTITEQSAYSDAGLTQKLPYSITLNQGQSAYLVLKIRNDSNQAWNKSVALATSAPRDRSSAFHDSSWISSNRTTVFSEPQAIQPGQTGTFVFKINATTKGTFREYYNLVWEGRAWFNDLGAYYPIVVQ